MHGTRTTRDVPLRRNYSSGRCPLLQMPRNLNRSFSDSRSLPSRRRGWSLAETAKEGSQNSKSPSFSLALGISPIRAWLFPSTPITFRWEPGLKLKPSCRARPWETSENAAPVSTMPGCSAVFTQTESKQWLTGYRGSTRRSDFCRGGGRVFEIGPLTR